MRGRVTVTATLNQAARPDPTVVNVTVAGVTATAGDFTAVPPFDVTIPAGDSSATAMFTLAPVDDDTDEADETVGVTGTTTAQGLTVGPAVAPTVTIADNDATPTVTLVLDAGLDPRERRDEHGDGDPRPSVERGYDGHGFGGGGDQYRSETTSRRAARR